VDNAGNLYIGDSFGYLWRVDHAAQIITVVAGNGTLGFGGDGGPASSASLSTYVYPLVDASGNIFIVDQRSDRIRRIDATSQIITTVAGGGTGGDGGPASSAVLSSGQGVGVDRSGNILIPDEGNYRLRRVDASTGIITTVAGNGIANLNLIGDNSPASAGFFPSGVALDAAGDLFIENAGGYAIREVNAVTGNITTIAGNGTPGYSGDGCPATNASLNLTQTPGVTLDSSGNLFIADTYNCAIRRVDANTQTITTFAGNGACGYGGDGGPAAGASLTNPYAVAFDSMGNLFIAGGNRLRRVDSVTGIISTVAGNGSQGLGGDGGPAVNALLDIDIGLAVDSSGNIYIFEQGNRRVRRISAFPFASLSSSSVAFTPSGSGSIPPQVITLYNTGTVPLDISSIVASYGYNQTNTCGSTLAPGASCTITITPTTNGPQTGTVTITDNSNGLAGSVTSVHVQTGATINTVAGGGPNNFPALNVGLSGPTSVAFDATGNNYYVAAPGQHRVFKVNNTSGTLTVFAGNGSFCPTTSSCGDGQSALNATFAQPTGVALDGAGNLYIADQGAARIRKVSGGIISTVAGNGTWGYSGDNGPATSASLSGPYSVALDGAGNLYIADTFNNRIRMVNTSGTITTVAGGGSGGCNPTDPCGDWGPATSAILALPYGVAADPAGNLFIADTFHNRIRAVNLGFNPSAPIIGPVAGNGQPCNLWQPPGNCGDGGLASLATLSTPYGVALAGLSLLVTDSGNNSVRRVISIRLRVIPLLPLDREHPLPRATKS
jgi:sugar lactone lactonase YvrE